MKTYDIPGPQTAVARTDTVLPADPSPARAGKYERHIRVSFLARAQGLPQTMGVRLTGHDYSWLYINGVKKKGHEALVMRTVSEPSPKRYECVVGPVRCDEPCLVRLEVFEGPVGEGNAIHLSDLCVEEVRKA